MQSMRKRRSNAIYMIYTKNICINCGKIIFLTALTLGPLVYPLLCERCQHHDTAHTEIPKYRTIVERPIYGVSVSGTYTINYFS